MPEKILHIKVLPLGSSKNETLLETYLNREYSKKEFSLIREYLVKEKYRWLRYSLPSNFHAYSSDTNGFMVLVFLGVLTSKLNREMIFARDGNKCLCCGTMNNLTLDHVIPKSQGGSNKQENLQTLCMDCNQRKGNTYIDFRNEI